jgi:hypothetical protein
VTVSSAKLFAVRVCQLVRHSHRSARFERDLIHAPQIVCTELPATQQLVCTISARELDRDVIHPPQLPLDQAALDAQRLAHAKDAFRASQLQRAIYGLQGFGGSQWRSPYWQ